MSDNSNKLFNITVLIAVVPAYIYFCSFEYEQGFCDHFNIPTYLISPNLTTILIFATSIWSILFSALKMLGFSTPLFKNVKNENKKHLQPVRFINGVFLVIVILMFYLSVQLLVNSNCRYRSKLHHDTEAVAYGPVRIWQCCHS